MKTTISVAATLAIVLASSNAMASNALYLSSDSDLSNVATLDISGDFNGLQISQSFQGPGLANSINLQIEGDLNGGPLGATFSAVPARLGLAPGQITQVGYANAIDIHVSGSNNLFAASQVGSQNTLTAMIVGSYNQAAVSQVGSGNTTVFTQNGTGNVLSVVQRSF
jgi:hypothetical protein